MTKRLGGRLLLGAGLAVVATLNASAQQPQGLSSSVCTAQYLAPGAMPSSTCINPLLGGRFVENRCARPVLVIEVETPDLSRRLISGGTLTLSPELLQSNSSFGGGAILVVNYSGPFLANSPVSRVTCAAWAG